MKGSRLGVVLGLTVMIATAACGGTAEPTPGASQPRRWQPPHRHRRHPASRSRPRLRRRRPRPAASLPATAFPLGEPGPYHVSRRTLTTKDPDRSDRQVAITVWYPAVRPANWKGERPSFDATPDRSGAPYPLILSSTTMAMELAPDVVSHGFAWASVNNINTWFTFGTEAIDQPLDILFALDQVAANPPEGLEGVIDAERAGAVGYSFDGFNTLAMSGARVDPEYYLAQCPTPDATTTAVISELSAFGCGPADDWAAFAAHAGEDITASDDGLWRADDGRADPGRDADGRRGLVALRPAGPRGRRPANPDAGWHEGRALPGERADLRAPGGARQGHDLVPRPGPLHDAARP